MRFFPHIVVAAVTLFFVGIPVSKAATKCLYDAKTLTGKGCPENYKCSPSGVCEVSFTASEIEQAMAPQMPAGFDPPPLFLCDGTKGWGMVNGSCLPTCEILATMWGKHLGSVGIDPNKQFESSYIQNKQSCEYKPNTLNRSGCMQGEIKSVYVPKELTGWKCCAKLCAPQPGGKADPLPPDYSKIPAPNLGDPAAPPSQLPGAAPAKPGAVPPVQLGPPLNPVTGKPLPSGPDPMKPPSDGQSRPFGNGPAPKKPK